MSTVAKPVGKPVVKPASNIVSDSVGGSAGYARPTAGGNAAGQDINGKPVDAHAAVVPDATPRIIPVSGGTAGDSGPGLGQ